MHAPGHAPIGPLNAGTVDVGVFPEDLERASEMLAEWPAQDAIVVNDDESSPAPTSDGQEPARSVASPPQSTSPIAVVLLIAALGAMVAAWMLSTAR